jgi:hypothetical protein
VADEVIRKDAWRAFCDRLSRLLEGKRAEVEVDSLGLGAQIEAEWAPVVGVSYDPKDDVFSVAVGGKDDLVDHLVHRPLTLAVRWDGPAVEALAITDSDGAMHLVRFREAQMLPSP